MAFLRASGSAITPIPAVTQHSDLITFRGKQYRFAPSNLEALITPAALNPSVNRTLYFDDVGHASADGSPVKPYRLDTILSGGTGGPTITNGDKIMIKGNHTYSAYAGNTGPLTINGKSDITIGWWGDSPPRLTTERTVSYGSAFRILDSSNVTILPGIIIHDLLQNAGQATGDGITVEEDCANIIIDGVQFERCGRSCVKLSAPSYYATPKGPYWIQHCYMLDCTDWPQTSNAEEMVNCTGGTRRVHVLNNTVHNPRSDYGCQFFVCSGAEVSASPYDSADKRGAGHVIAGNVLTGTINETFTDFKRAEDPDPAWDYNIVYGNTMVNDDFPASGDGHVLAPHLSNPGNIWFANNHVRRWNVAYVQIQHSQADPWRDNNRYITGEHNYFHTKRGVWHGSKWPSTYFGRGSYHRHDYFLTEPIGIAAGQYTHELSHPTTFENCTFRQDRDDQNSYLIRWNPGNGHSVMGTAGTRPRLDRFTMRMLRCTFLKGHNTAWVDTRPLYDLVNSGGGGLGLYFNTWAVSRGINVGSQIIETF